MDEEMTMLIGPATDGTLLEIGIVRREGDTLIAHAMIARRKFLG
jgi:hypothetical protein